MSKRQILYAVNIVLAAGCITLLVLLAQRWYCNRLELLETIETEFYTIQQYIDWSKSKYCCKDKFPWVRGDKHHIVVKCNGSVLIKFRDIDCYGETEPCRISYIQAVQNDTLVLKRRSYYKRGLPLDVFIYVPLRAGKITNAKNVTIKAYRYLVDSNRQVFYPTNPTPLDSLCYEMHLW